MKRSQTIRFVFFTFVLTLAAMFQLYTIRANRITLGQPLEGGGIFVAQAYFPGGYGAIAFDSADALKAFIRMPHVDVEPVAARLKISEVGQGEVKEEKDRRTK